MSDDLVKRLRATCSCNIDNTPCLAEEECRVAQDAADRIEELEAKLAKAVQLIDDIFSDHGMDECVCELCTSYVERRAELTGGKDE